MAKRPPIPADLEREILLEAGHRCAIHTCRQAPVELAHIVPWAKCKEHSFDNIIALCPTCHTRFDNGEIDRKSMLEYKLRLWRLAGNLTLFELRLLRKMSCAKSADIWLLDDLELLVDGLISSGLLVFADQSKSLGLPDGPTRKLYRLTAHGSEFLERYLLHES